MKRERGVVATEAILSFALLLTALLLLWSSVRLVYEKTALDTASALAAQGGVTYFLRNSPISCNPSAEFGNKCEDAYVGAENLAKAIFESNVCDETGRSLGSETGDLRFCETNYFTVSVQCRIVLSSDSPPAPEQFLEDNCTLSDAQKKDARALIVRFSAEGEVPVEGGILDRVVGGDFSTKSSAYGWRSLNDE